MAKQELNCSTKPKISTCCPFSDYETPFLERLSDHWSPNKYLHIYQKRHIFLSYVKYNLIAWLWTSVLSLIFKTRSHLWKVKKFSFFCEFCLAKMAYSFCALYCKMNPGAKSMPYTQKIQLSAAPPDLNCSAPHFLHNILFWRSVLVWYGMVRRHVQA